MTGKRTLTVVIAALAIAVTLGLAFASAPATSDPKDVLEEVSGIVVEDQPATEENVNGKTVRAYAGERHGDPCVQVEFVEAGFKSRTCGPREGAATPLASSTVGGVSYVSGLAAEGVDSVEIVGSDCKAKTVKAKDGLFADFAPEGEMPVLHKAVALDKAGKKVGEALFKGPGTAHPAGC